MTSHESELQSERQLEIAATHDQLLAVCAWLEEMAADWSLPPRLAYGLDLVLAEAVTNVMDYACNQDSAMHITLHGSRKNDAVEIELADNGPAFNPVEHPQAALPTRLVDATPGGLGIRLMQQYTTAMHYRRESDRNHLTLIFPMSGVVPGARQATN